MADGAYRFQGAGQYFYPQTNQQSHHARQIHQRNGSPINNPRIGFHSNDTPSPNRSPGTHSPAFSMFSQGHQGTQHMLNGNSHQQYQMRMNMPKHFQHQSNQHQGHHQNQQHHDHGGHNGHGGAFGNHQHNMSTGTLSNATAHFTPGHLQSGTPLGGHSVPSKPTSEHWQEQMRLAQASREATQPHHYARNHPGVNKQVIATTQAGIRKDEDKEERNRIAVAGNKGEKQVWHALDFGGQGLKTISTSLLRYRFLERLYLNQNKLTWIMPSIGTLRQLTFLDLSQNQIHELPPEIGMLVNLKNLLLFDNQLETFPYELGYLYRLETLGVEGNPLREEIKSVIADHGTSGLIEWLREDAPAPDPPAERDWIVVDETPMESSEQDRFSVLSYNILCDKAATQSQYGYTSTRALAWETRRDIVLNELRARDPDIICLQEVDSESFNEYFRPSLAHGDYKGVYWQKSRARTMAEKESKLVDGCATFYKNSKYILLDKQLIEFARNAINRPDMKGEHDMFNRVMPRDDIATVTFLENRVTGARLIVVNTHIFWNPVFQDVKIIQVAILLEQLARLVDTYAKWPACKDKELFRYSNGDDDELNGNHVPVQPGPSQKYVHGSDIPLLVCGDFNSTPDSGVCDLLSHGKLSNSHSDLAGHNYGNFTRDGMQHPFQLKSSYAHVGELPFTNYVADFEGVLDYIWYSTNTLQVTALLGEVDKSYLERVPGFPNCHFPSDHLSLLAEFEVKARKEKKVVEVDFGPQRDRRA